MQTEESKKVKKWLNIIVVTIILIILCSIITLRWLASGIRYWNWKSTHPPYGYLISGRGCNDMANVSDEELKVYIKSDILNELSKKKFKKILLNKKRNYDEGKYYKDDSCYLMVNRVISIINSM